MLNLVTDPFLLKIISSDYFSSETVIEDFIRDRLAPFPKTIEDFSSALKERAPLINWEIQEGEENQISVKIITKYRLNISQFFYQLITKGTSKETVPVNLFFSSDFSIQGIEGKWTFCQMVFSLQKKEFLNFLEKKKVIETEISLGAMSSYHAEHIGVFKGLSPDAKTKIIHEKITSLISSGKKTTDPQIFSSMQNFLVTCQEDFKNKRDSAHLTKIISLVHLLRELLEKKVKQFPDKRHSIVKFIKTNITEKNTRKGVLGILVGVNFLKKYEIFEESHLIKAVSVLIPGVKSVKNSFFIDPCKDKKIQVIYLEIEKNGEVDFSLDEVRTLKEHLSEKVKASIESLMHAVFMPRNEEEVFRDIVTLSKQVKYVHDIPQVIINFQHKQEPLVFTVIMCRLLSKGRLSTKVLLERSAANISIERSKVVGVIRKKHIKEASVLKVVLPSHSFVRFDNSIDLYKAREHILAQLEKCFGSVRDYNGGMIDKQNQLLASFKKLCGQMVERHELLMEKFFFSIRPQEIRILLEPEQVKSLFFLFFNMYNQVNSNSKFPNKLLVKKEKKHLYVVIKEDLKKILNYLDCKKNSFRLICFHYTDLEEPICGLILKGEEEEGQESFLQLLNAYF